MAWHDYLNYLSPVKAGYSALPASAKQNLKEFAFGRPEQLQQIPQPFSQNQIGALNQLLSMGLGGLQQTQNVNPYAGFQPLAQQAQQNFYQNTVPTLAERFSLGTGGSLSSPSFASSLGQAGQQFNTDLAAMAAQYGLANRAQLQSERGQLAQLLSLGLTPQYQNYLRPEASGFFGNLLRGSANAAVNYGIPLAMGYGGFPGGAIGMGQRNIWS